MAIPSTIRDAVVAIIYNTNVSQLNIAQIKADESNNFISLNMESDTANLVSGCMVKIVSPDWTGTLTNTTVTRNYYGSGKHRVRGQSD